MIETRTLRKLLGFIAMVSLVIVMPACSSPGCPRPPWLQRFWPGSTNVVQRPTYQDAEKRPFVLGGYAGASYGPFPFGRSRFVGSPVPAVPDQAGPSVEISNGAWEPE
jgi:hypothetical protein